MAAVDPELIKKWMQEDAIKRHPASMVYWPDERLKRPAMPVPANWSPRQYEFYSAVMLDRMILYKGVGMAANQLGLPFRWFIIDQSAKGRDMKVFINPEYFIPENAGFDGGHVHSQEGCLSAPGFSTKVHRLARVNIKAMNEKGELVEHRLDGFEAIIAQHEMDHLDGECIVDNAPKLQRVHYMSLIKNS